MHLVLASASPRRKNLLEEAGYTFTTVPAAVEEDPADTPLPLPELVERNAALKAGWVSSRRPGSICLGADTLVSVDGKALGKPVDLEEAARMLSLLVGRTHQVCTGVCLQRTTPDEQTIFHVTTNVTFRPLGTSEIQAYLQKIDPLDKAGAYAAQEHGEMIIETVTGSWTNVVGLPMEKLREKLDRFGR